MPAVDQTGMRRANLALVLRLLRDNDGLSRAQVATESGLSKASVSNLAAELVERGLVQEGAPERIGAVGRPGLRLGLDGRAVAGLGIEISGEYLAAAAVDLSGSVIRETEVPLDVAHAGVPATLDRVARLARRVADSLEAAGSQIVALTVAGPGVIDYEAETLRFAPNLGWRSVPIVAELRKRLGPAFPAIRLENDAKLSALAEYTAGYARSGVHDLVYLAGWVGVGAGIIADGRLMRGHSGYSGEVGHLPLDPSNRPCACGRTGCWEGMVSLAALLRLAVPEDDPEYATIHDHSLRLEDRLAVLQQRAVEGHAGTRAALEQVGRDLGLGLSVVVDVLNPEVVVLGGWFALFGDFLLEPLRADLARRRMADGSEVRLETSRLGLTATSHGGALVAVEDVFTDPLIVPSRS